MTTEQAELLQKIYDLISGNFKGIKYLGSGNSFNIKDSNPLLDYTKLTNENFIGYVDGGSASRNGGQCTDYGSGTSALAQASYTQLSFSYNNTTGILTVSGGTITSTIRGSVQNGGSQSTNLTNHIYLLTDNNS